MSVRAKRLDRIFTCFEVVVKQAKIVVERRESSSSHCWPCASSQRHPDHVLSFMRSTDEALHCNLLKDARHADDQMWKLSGSASVLSDLTTALGSRRPSCRFLASGMMHDVDMMGV